MAAMTIRNLPDETHRAIKLRAKLKGRSAEAEVRASCWAGWNSISGAIRRRLEVRSVSNDPAAWMILIDTNVLSEPTKPIPNGRVLAWLNSQPSETLFLAATSFAESLAGLATPWEI